MAETKTSFFFKHTELIVLPEVYFPREDSLLLANAVEVKPNDLVLDLGTGCGIQAINAASQGARVLAVDLNSKAVENTLLNAKNTGLAGKITVKKSNLFKEVKEKFDAIIFNPPYVPSEKTKLLDVDGGKQGRETLDCFLKEFKNYLNDNGKCFFLQSSLNGIKKTERLLMEQNLEFEVIARQKLFFEELLVFKCVEK